jgi:hypothetical protein
MDDIDAAQNQPWSVREDIFRVYSYYIIALGERAIPFPQKPITKPSDPQTICYNLVSLGSFSCLPSRLFQPHAQAEKTSKAKNKSGHQLLGRTKYVKKKSNENQPTILRYLLAVLTLFLSFLIPFTWMP